MICWRRLPIYRQQWQEYKFVILVWRLLTPKYRLKRTIHFKNVFVTNFYTQFCLVYYNFYYYQFENLTFFLILLNIYNWRNNLQNRVKIKMYILQCVPHFTFCYCVSLYSSEFQMLGEFLKIRIFKILFSNICDNWGPK